MLEVSAADVDDDDDVDDDADADDSVSLSVAVVVVDVVVDYVSVDFAVARPVCPLNFPVLDFR